MSREGNLEAPTRHPLGWQSADFWDSDKLNAELERVFDICHGCRKCVSLCQAFPTLFDLIDESEELEVEGVAKADYAKVVDQCYLCDLCYQVKCPYVPPHEWNVDFPHLMLRAKAVKFKQAGAKASHKFLTATTKVGKLATLPVVVNAVNAANKSPAMRGAMEKTLGVHRDAHVPTYHRNTLTKRARQLPEMTIPAQEAGPTRGKVALFGTCYCNFNEPNVGEDLIKVFQHNDIPTKLVERTRCCGMPKLELGDLQSAAKFKQHNLPLLLEVIDQGYDIVTPIPSCTLMFKQELPLMFPDDAQVQRVKAHMFDPFEYLAHRHKAGLLRTEFTNRLGKVVYHAPCHQRVQNIGPKTRDILRLVSDIEIDMIERCSGHDGTYGVRKETYELSMKIARPVVNRITKAEPDHVSSDCPMAAAHLAHGVAGDVSIQHPLSLLRLAYGI